MKTLYAYGIADFLAKITKSFDWAAAQKSTDFFVQPSFRIGYNERPVEAALKEAAREVNAIREKLDDILALFSIDELVKHESYYPNIPWYRDLHDSYEEYLSWLVALAGARNRGGKYECALVSFGTRGGKEYSIEYTGEAGEREYVLTISNEDRTQFFRCFAPEAVDAKSMAELDEIKERHSGDGMWLDPDEFTTFYADSWQK